MVKRMLVVLAACLSASGQLVNAETLPNLAQAQTVIPPDLSGTVGQPSEGGRMPMVTIPEDRSGAASRPSAGVGSAPVKAKDFTFNCLNGTNHRCQSGSSCADVPESRPFKVKIDYENKRAWLAEGSNPLKQVTPQSWNGLTVIFWDNVRQDSREWSRHDLRFSGESMQIKGGSETKVFYGKQGQYNYFSEFYRIDCEVGG